MYLATFRRCFISHGNISYCCLLIQETLRTQNNELKQKISKLEHHRSLLENVSWLSNLKPPKALYFTLTFLIKIPTMSVTLTNIEIQRDFGATKIVVVVYTTGSC